MGKIRKWWISLSTAYSNFAVAAAQLDYAKREWRIKYKPYSFIIIFMDKAAAAVFAVFGFTAVLYLLFG